MNLVSLNPTSYMWTLWITLGPGISPHDFRASREASTFPATVGNDRFTVCPGGREKSFSKYFFSFRRDCTVQFLSHGLQISFLWKNITQFTKLNVATILYQQTWQCSLDSESNTNCVFYLIDRFNHVVMPSASHHYYDDNTLALSATPPLRSLG